MKILGLKMAPLRVPLERRLQTLAVVTQLSMVVVFPWFFGLLFLVLLFTPLFFVPVGYVSFALYDFYIRKSHQTGSRRSESVRKWKFWNYYRDYFPVSLVKTAELDPRKTYVMGHHPHGIVPCGAFANFNTDSTGFSKMFPGITPHLLTLTSVFTFPVSRIVSLWLGTRDASRESIRNILTKEGPGNAAVIVIGGAEEAFYGQPGDYRLKLKMRKGFVRQAVKAGASLVPMFSFGELNTWVQVQKPEGSFFKKVQNGVKKILGVPLLLFHGRGIFNYTMGILPFRTPITTVVGSPLDVEKMEEPTEEIVDKYHKLYIEALTQLFEDHKTQYGVSQETKLILV